MQVRHLPAMLRIVLEKAAFWKVKFLLRKDPIHVWVLKKRMVGGFPTVSTFPSPKQPMPLLAPMPDSSACTSTTLGLPSPRPPAKEVVMSVLVSVRFAFWYALARG